MVIVLYRIVNFLVKISENAILLFNNKIIPLQVKLSRFHICRTPLRPPNQSVGLAVVYPIAQCLVCHGLISQRSISSLFVQNLTALRVGALYFVLGVITIPWAAEPDVKYLYTSQG